MTVNTGVLLVYNALHPPCTEQFTATQYVLSDLYCELSTNASTSDEQPY